VTHRSAEEALKEDVAVLGIAYGTAFHHCKQELWRVSANWDRYETLFGSQERVAILNSSSGNFWYVIQGVLFEHVMLGICRLTDPAGSKTRQNLSVSRLLEVDPTSTKRGLESRVTAASRKSEFARSWRDKRIAHNDLTQITGAANLLAPATGRKISAALVAIHDVLRWVQGRYFNGDMYLLDLGDSDANVLLGALTRAKALKDKERDDLAAGRFESLLTPIYRYLSDDYGKQRRYAGQDRRKQPRTYRGRLPLVT